MSFNLVFRPFCRQLVISRGNCKSTLKGVSIVRFASTETQQERKDGQAEIISQEKIQLRRPEINRIKRPPFAKQLFLGILNTDLLEFPEILDSEHLPDLEAHVKQLNNIFKDKANPMKIDKEGKLPEYLLQDFRELGLFGRLIPKQYGGLELTMTEYTRLNEVIGLDWSLAASLNAHELLATQAILLAGTEAQKAKYLPDLASGNRIAASCFFESHNGHDNTKPKTDAKWLPEHNCYSLSGTKSWVTNGQFADLFVVFCKTAELTDEDEKMAMFVVDRNLKGITVTPLNDKIGLKATGAAVVQFMDVAVKKEDMIGPLGNGLQILNKTIELCRFGMSSITIGTLKSLVDHVTEYVINTDRHNKALSNLELVREILTKITRKIYAMESVSYYTAAIMDCSEDPDCAIESYVSKAFNSEGTLYCLSEMIKLCGVLSFSENHILSKLYRDALLLASFDGPNDIIKLYIGLLGCQYAGQKRAELVMQNRNPMLFPMLRLRNFFRASRIKRGNVKYTQDIAGHLHPSLLQKGNRLEECVQRLDYATYSLLSEEGPDVVDTQFDPTRLADMLIDIYVSTAVLVRSSRSYCIGLRNADEEIKIACGITDEAYQRVVKAFYDICIGPHCILDTYAIQTGTQVVKSRGYFPQHPLKHNF